MPPRAFFILAAACCFLSALVGTFAVRAQEDTASANPSPATTPSPAQTSSPTEMPARNVRLSFLPPPMEGTISLGIFDSAGKLVRVLYREAELDDFTVGQDALHTTWDGRDDAGNPLPAGKYRAHGYVVGELKIDDVGDVSADMAEGAEKVKMKLVANPLTMGDRQTVEVSAAFDEDATYLQTADGLPLATIDEDPGIVRVALKQRSDKSLVFSEDDGDSVTQFRVTGAEKMMAFDCGAFDLK